MQENLNTNSEESCANCKFYFEIDKDYHGICRRLPPVLLFDHEARRSHLNAPYIESRFPGVNTDGWCGEFKRKPDA